MFSIYHAVIAMTCVVAASNVLVLFPINDWVTWGCFVYPISYLITELTNRTYGPQVARRVIYWGFTVGVLMSIGLATPRVACASGLAFFTSQCLDVSIFNRLRNGSWWQGPLLASICASLVDAALFWPLAFYGEDLPVLQWALYDTAFKCLVDVSMLLPFRLALRRS